MWYPTICEANGAVSRFSLDTAPSLPELKKSLDNALRPVVRALLLSCVGPGVGI